MAFSDFKNGVTGSGLSADTATFTLLGGRYAVAAVATWGGGSVSLEMLMPDGSTYLAVVAPFTANNSTIAYLPPGTYKFAITTATAVALLALPVPYRPAP